MKISKKEKYLLGILGTVLVSVMYYQFVYTPQVNRIENLKLERDEKKQEYTTIMETIRTLDERKGKIKGLNQQIIDKSNPFYPEIIQENLILELDKLLADSNLKGTISFSTITVGQVEMVTDGVNSNLQTSFDSIVDEYNSNFKEELQESQTEGQNTEDQATTETIVQEEQNQEVISSDTNSGEIQISDNTATVEQIKVSLSFTGSYTALKDFVRLVNTNERKIVITNISLSGQGEGEDVSGSMNLEFYAIPKLGDTDSEYYIWLLNNTYGKEYPFSNSAASGTTIEELASNDSAYDFIMLSKPITSDIPSVMIGKANDEQNISYVYSDNSEVEIVEVVLTEQNGKYYYKYKAGNSQYPLSYNGNGIEFTPVGDEILINIISTKRLSDDDKSGISIVLTNNTNKEVNVVIENEDESRPRVSIASEGNNVKITNK